MENDAKKLINYMAIESGVKLYGVASISGVMGIKKDVKLFKVHFTFMDPMGLNPELGDIVMVNVSKNSKSSVLSLGKVVEVDAEFEGDFPIENLKPIMGVVRIGDFEGYEKALRDAIKKISRAKISSSVQELKSQLGVGEELSLSIGKDSGEVVE